MVSTLTSTPSICLHSIPTSSSLDGKLRPIENDYNLHCACSCKIFVTSEVFILNLTRVYIHVGLCLCQSICDVNHNDLDKAIIIL